MDLFAAAAAEGMDVPPWVWDLVQGLIGLLLTVVGLYLGGTVKGLRADVQALRVMNTKLADNFAAVDKRLTVVETKCEARHGSTAAAATAGG